MGRKGYVSTVSGSVVCARNTRYIDVAFSVYFHKIWYYFAVSTVVS